MSTPAGPARVAASAILLSCLCAPFIIRDHQGDSLYRKERKRVIRARHNNSGKIRAEVEDLDGRIDPVVDGLMTVRINFTKELIWNRKTLTSFFQFVNLVFIRYSARIRVRQSV